MLQSNHVQWQSLIKKRAQTCGGVLEVRQGEVDGEFPSSGANLCPLSHWYTAAVICLTATHIHEDVCS